MVGNGNITIRKALPSDEKYFADLIVVSAPYFPVLFGEEVRTIMQRLFRQRHNLFSFEHAYFAEVSGEKVAMILGYDWRIKKRENWGTGFLLVAEMKFDFLGKLPLLMKFNKTVGTVSDGEYYISTIATYSQHRGMGVGTRLIFEVEEEAERRDAERIALDVEKENIGAIKLYKKLGYPIIKEFSIQLHKDKVLSFYRMSKELK